MKRIISEIGCGILHCLVAALTFSITGLSWLLFFLPGVVITFVCLLIALFVPVPRAKALAIAAIIGCALCIPWMIFSLHGPH